MYLVPRAQSINPTWHYIDGVSGKMVEYAHNQDGLSSEAYAGGALCPAQNRIYFAPYMQAPLPSWHFVDCGSGEVGSYAHNTGANFLPLSPAYYGAVYAPPMDRVYFVPHEFARTPVGRWHYVDCVTGTVAEYAHGYAGIFQNAAYLGGIYIEALQRIYMAPFGQGNDLNLHYIDVGGGTTTVGTYANHPAAAANAGYSGLAYCPSLQRIYFAPYEQGLLTSLHYLDVTTNTMVAYPNPLPQSRPYHGAEYLPSLDRIYFGPYERLSSNWEYVDCATGNLSLYPVPPEAEEAGRYFGAALNPLSDRVYFVPILAPSGLMQYISPCPPAFYLDSGRVCAACTPIARALSGATYTCTNALDSRVSECEAGFRPDTSTYVRGLSPGTCEACLGGCFTCTEAATCVECDNDLVLFFGRLGCGPVCPPGQYDAGDASPTTPCAECLPFCEICVDAETCARCETTHVLNAASNECVPVCQTGEFLEGTPENTFRCTAGLTARALREVLERVQRAGVSAIMIISGIIVLFVLAVVAASRCVCKDDYNDTYYTPVVVTASWALDIVVDASFVSSLGSRPEFRTEYIVGIIALCAVVLFSLPSLLFTVGKVLQKGDVRSWAGEHRLAMVVGVVLGVGRPENFSLIASNLFSSSTSAFCLPLSATRRRFLEVASISNLVVQEFPLMYAVVVVQTKLDVWTRLNIIKFALGAVALSAGIAMRLFKLGAHMEARSNRHIRKEELKSISSLQSLGGLSSFNLEMSNRPLSTASATEDDAPPTQPTGDAAGAVRANPAARQRPASTASAAATKPPPSRPVANPPPQRCQAPMSLVPAHGSSPTPVSQRPASMGAPQPPKKTAAAPDTKNAAPIPKKNDARWTEVEGEDGQVYFYNPATEECVWELPDDSV